MSASWALQQAAFAALSSDATVKSLLGDPARIFDDVPRDAAMPYVTIGEDGMSDWSTATDTGSQHALAIHAWSRAAGRKEVKGIADAVRVVLDGAALSVTGLIDLRFLSAEYSRESDGITYHATLRFRATLEN